MKGGPAPKPDATRQRHGKPQTLSLSGVRVVDPPSPPAGLSPAVRGWWRAFWDSDLAPLLRATDLPALARLFEAYSDRERVRKQMNPNADRKPTPPRQRKGEGHNDWQHRQSVWRREQAMAEFVVYDDRGGVKSNPLVRIAADLDSTIVALEDRFGFNPAARAKLGLSQLRVMTLAEQNAAQAAAPRDPEEPDYGDPRDSLRVLQTKPRRSRRPTREEPDGD
jgi:phage terminase small subunit